MDNREIIKNIFPQNTLHVQQLTPFESIKLVKGIWEIFDFFSGLNTKNGSF